jgi:hypothetical protein
MLPDNTDDRGTPDLEIAGLSIWVNRRFDPQSMDAYLIDLLMATACCSNDGATVWLRCNVTSSGVAGFASRCEHIHSHLQGKAELSSDELSLEVALEATDRAGHVTAVVEIRPHHADQQHRFTFRIDQSHLPAIVRQCRAILTRYPNPHSWE